MSNLFLNSNLKNGCNIPKIDENMIKNLFLAKNEFSGQLAMFKTGWARNTFWYCESMNFSGVRKASLYLSTEFFRWESLSYFWFFPFWWTYSLEINVHIKLILHIYHYRRTYSRDMFCCTIGPQKELIRVLRASPYVAEQKIFMEIRRLWVKI